MDLSVVLATFNGGAQLQSCLDMLGGSIERSNRSVEVIIADDGSSDPRTSEIIRDFRSRSRCRVEHCWQEDRGFRLARSRNNAIVSTTGRYLVFLDHDIIVPPRFIDVVHRTMRPGWFLGGRRVCLGIAESNRFLSGHGSSSARFWTAAVHGGVNRRSGARYLLPLRDRTPKAGTPQDWRGMAGFCLVAPRDVVVAIDGFDGGFEGYGVEDWDFMARLANADLKAAFLPRSATVLHLWHRETPPDPSSPLYRELEETILSGRVAPRAGISSITVAEKDHA